MKNQYTQLELFAGIGGFGLALEMTGRGYTVAQVEKDKFCLKVLEKNFPDAKRYEDIKQFDGTKYRGAIDIISGGFPCQPFSNAGKRKGTSDDRYLWPEMLRVIREVQPFAVVAENVPGIKSLENGATFKRVCADLEGEGYEVQVFNIPSCSVGAWHRRERIWFVAYDSSKRQPQAKKQHKTNSGRKQNEKTGQGWIEKGLQSEFRGHDKYDNANTKSEQSKRKIQPEFSKKEQREFGRISKQENVSNTNIERQPRQGKYRGSMYSEQDQERQEHRTFNVGKLKKKPMEAIAELCRINDGVSKGLDKNIMHRLKGLGNAIVPQVAAEIFNFILDFHELENK